MQEESADHTPSISQRAYGIAKSLSELKASLFSLLGFVLFFLFFMILNAYTPPSDPEFDKLWVPLTFVVTSVGLIWYIIKGRQLDRNFKDWMEDYLEQTYILVFGTTIPKGDSTSEKILGLAKPIFPELRSNYIPPGIRDRIKLYFKRKLGKSEKMIISESMNYKVSSDYSVDLALRTSGGYFIVKEFKDKVVSLEDLNIIPYNQWAAKWWQWTQSIPGPVHPRDHPSEQNCKVVQQGPVWFLADLLSGTQDRTCTIPASKSIFVSLVGGFCGSDSAGVTNDASLRQCALAGDNYATVQATLDGKEIKNLDQYRIKYGPFMINYGNNNIYGHKAGTARGDVDGYYLFLKPLPPGQHVLDLKTSVLNPVDSSYNYSADLIYHITTQ